MQAVGDKDGGTTDEEVAEGSGTDCGAAEGIDVRDGKRGKTERERKNRERKQLSEVRRGPRRKGQSALCEQRS